VVAKTDVECYRLDRAAFQSLLLARPEIAEEIAKIISSRRDGLEQVREAFKASPAVEIQKDLLARIRRFFGIQA